MPRNKSEKRPRALTTAEVAAGLGVSFIQAADALHVLVQRGQVIRTKDNRYYNASKSK